MDSELEGIILSELEGERIPDGFAYMYNLEKPKNQTKTNCKPNPWKEIIDLRHSENKEKERE